eukprot:TRINITY_DN10556_c0_g1_i1.p1 TRINITY_DN10556_c0_g1~~TRINITY_DN10556_c0_g1_i1.p1  ORF type:complete len:342 (-),score=96.44 TRINITY_DN10556_c0_g1_i1:63-1088(-)
MQEIPSTYKAWLLKTRPTGNETLGRKHLELGEIKTPDVEEGGALVKTTFLSFDASQQIMASGGSNYFKQELDKPMFCLAVGTIVKVGNNSKYPLGTKLHYRGSYAEYEYLNAEALIKAIPYQKDIEDEDFLSVGSFTTGLTSYVGLWQVCKDNIKPGNTLVVSAASGGVGQIVVQMGKLEGLRVVGITGGEEKCKDLVKNLGVDVAVDYRDPQFAKKLQEACPNKVDIYFDNVGGNITDQVFANLNTNARIAICGLLTDYVEKKGHTFQYYSNVLMSRSRIEGFLVGENLPLLFEGSNKITTWLKEKKLKFEKTIIDFKDAPEGISILLSGEKKGKLIARV